MIIEQLLETCRNMCEYLSLMEKGKAREARSTPPQLAQVRAPQGMLCAAPELMLPLLLPSLLMSPLLMSPLRMSPLRMPPLLLTLGCRCR